MTDATPKAGPVVKVNPNFPLDLERGSPAPIPGRCGALVRQTAEPRYCENWPIRGAPRCRLHGGKSLSGVESPTWRGRGYSKDIPTRYADRLLAAEGDEELTSLRAEISLVDARMGEVLGSVATGESGEAWARVGSLAKKLQGALDANVVDDLPPLLEELNLAIGDARGERAAWGELGELIEQRRKLVDTERKREELLGATLTHKQAQTLIGALQQAVIDEVKDQETLKRVAQRFRLILNAGPAAVAAMDAAEGRAR